MLYLYSEPRRGAMWSLENGARLAHVRGFSGSYFVENDQALVTFPPVLTTDQNVYTVDLTTALAKK